VRAKLEVANPRYLLVGTSPDTNEETTKEKT
jgi:hypothetical protein